MRKLHLVGLTTDQKGLIFTARRGSDSGGYVVALDADVLNAIAKAQGRANGGPLVRPGGEYTPGPGSQARRRGLLTPREIQARLRAGRSVDDVAEEADVEAEWVERFAVPILAEQAQVVELAQSLVYAKPKVGSSSLPLEESVVWNLLDRGARVTDDAFDASWTAYQLHDQVWMIRFTYRSRGRAQEARWELDVGSGELLARNKVGAELAYVEAGARPRRPPPVESSDEADGAPAVKATSRAARPSTRKAVAAASGGKAKATPALDDADDGALDVLEDLEDDDEDADADADADADDVDADDDDTAEGDADADDDDEVEGEDDEADAPVGAATVAGASEAPVAAGVTTATAVSEAAAGGPPPDGSAAGSGAKAKARPKSRAKPAAAKAKKPAPPAPPEAPAPPPVRGLLVSSGRVTRPVPPSRGLLVSSPRMRAAKGGIASPAPAPDADGPAAPSDSAAGPPVPPAGPAATAKPSPTPEVPDAPADAPAGVPRPARAGSDLPEPAPLPGGAGVRKAVAQVTSVRVAASRALVARAMLPKPAPPVVSRPTLAGRVNQPIQEAPPVSIRSRSRDQAARPSEPAPDARPPLRLQPTAAEPDSGAVSPFRRSSRSEEAAPAGGDRDRPTDQPRSPFVPRPAPSGRTERLTGPRPPAGPTGPVVRPAPRPVARPEPGRPAARPEPGRSEPGRPDPGRADAGRTAAGRPEPGRPPQRRPEPGRPPARRPEPGRPDSARPAPGRPETGPEGRRPPERRPEERRPNDRRLDDRGRPAELDEVPGPDGRADGDDDRTGPFPSGAGGGRPRIAAQPAGDWRPSGGRQKQPAGPPVVPPPTGIEEPRPRRRLRRPPR